MTTPMKVGHVFQRWTPGRVSLTAFGRVFGFCISRQLSTESFVGCSFIAVSCTRIEPAKHRAPGKPKMMDFRNRSAPDEDDFVMVPPVRRRNESNEAVSDGSHVIHTDLLIPGRGDPVQNVSVVVEGGKISLVSSKCSLPAKFQELPSTKVPVLMPGLWDCHTHIVGTKSFRPAEIMNEHPVLAGVRLAASCNDILMGGYGCEVVKAIEEGVIVGPNIYSAGGILSQTAGHADVFDVPVGSVWQYGGVASGVRGPGATGSVMVVADGVDEVRKAVRLQIRRGAKVIKVCASGGVLSRDDSPLDQQFSDEELKAIVQEAERAKRVVAAHVHGKEGILAALRAGCHTLEHGSYLDEECVKLAKEKGVVYVATRTILVLGIDHPELMEPSSYDKMKEIAKHHQDAVSLAIKHGVTLATGCDLSMSVPGHPLSLGNSGGEPFYLTQAGMTPLQAIEAATANGPLTLGPQAPLAGIVKSGYDADLIALDTSPLDDIAVFMDPKNITHVWKGGRVFKCP